MKLSKADKQGVVVILGVVAVLIAILIAKIILDKKPKPGPDNCVGQVTSNTVMVLDHTDRLPDQTREEIVNRAWKHIREHVKVNERVSIFTVSDLSKKSLKPVVSLCLPPDDGNRAIENVALIRKRFQENFEQPIRKALSIEAGMAHQSPIAQAIMDISLSQYLRGSSNSLLIFSDMLENTERFSIYRCTNGVDVISRYRESRRGALERPAFENTRVILHLIPRFSLSKGELACRDRWLNWFFGNNGGEKGSFEQDYLPGGESITNVEKGQKK